MNPPSKPPKPMPLPSKSSSQSSGHDVPKSLTVDNSSLKPSPLFVAHHKDVAKPIKSEDGKQEQERKTKVPLSFSKPHELEEPPTPRLSSESKQQEPSIIDRPSISSSTSTSTARKSKFLSPEHWEKGPISRKSSIVNTSSSSVIKHNAETSEVIIGGDTVRQDDELTISHCIEEPFELGDDDAISSRNSKDEQGSQKGVELPSLSTATTTQSSGTSSVITTSSLSQPTPALQQRENQQVNEARRNIYHSTHFGVEWFYTSLLMHMVQFSFLLGLGLKALSFTSTVVIFFFIIAVVVLLLLSRLCTTKLPKSFDWSYKSIISPEKETDKVSDRVIYLLSLAAILEGAAYALYPISSAGKDYEVISEKGFKSYQTMTQILGFSSIVMFGFHRIIRPANRLDPLRTILEIEIMGVCWDALDGATLYQLLVDTTALSYSIDLSARVLVVFWYLSVGFRVALMFCAHLSPESTIYQFILPAATTWSDEPTVDRTLAGLNFKSTITLAMSLSQFFAAALRLTLMNQGNLDAVQQEMMVKNILFLLPTGGAIMKFYQTKGRYWNSRKIFQAKISYFNIFINIQKPSRSFQVDFLRYSFSTTYIIVGLMFSLFLTNVTDNFLWLGNIATDVLCIAIFLYACRQAHNPEVWIIFPKQLSFGLSVVLVSNLYLARIIGIYGNAHKMSESEEESWNYTNAMLIVLFSIIPISAYALFWSVCNMLFHSEFTACPGNYNAVHDPCITLVSVQTMIEGALDIVSCAALLSLATDSSIPMYMDFLIVLFALLEIFNACQCFVLQVILSGGHDDTPADFVILRSKLRLGRGIIDFGVFTLRLILWLRFDAVASVFMIKNLFNLLHTVALVERSRGVEHYTFDTLFKHYVNPRDWYGMTKEEWRNATRESIAHQARAGRVV